MGLPEVVDVARNYAVMVRIQGPDPKGLKMRKHAFHLYNSGKTTLSASGMLLPSSFVNASVSKQIQGESKLHSFGGHFLVLTVASVIEPFVVQQDRGDISKDKPELIPGAQIDILREGGNTLQNDIKVTNKEGLNWLPAELLRVVDIPVSSAAVQSLVEGSSSSIEHGWEVGWSLAAYGNSRQSFTNTKRTQVEQISFPSQTPMMEAQSSLPSVIGTSTTRIALLRVSSNPYEDLPKLKMSTWSRRGDLLLGMGSPFGILSPSHFFNSISVGSIANSYPPSPKNKALLIADIRCLPGMEGSPVLGEHAELIGVLSRPLRQRATAAEIQMVIPWEAITSACGSLLKEELQTRRKIHFDNGNLISVKKESPSNNIRDGPANDTLEHLLIGHVPPSLIEKAMTSICLITVDDGAWASGVLLNKQGLLLTNAHLLEPWRFGKTSVNGSGYNTKSDVVLIPSDQSEHPGAEKFDIQRMNKHLIQKELRTPHFLVDNEQGSFRVNLANTGSRTIRVRLDFMDPWVWTNAKVVHVSRGPLDVALLQLELVPDQLCPITADFICPSPGSKAYILGHGLFGPRCDFLPSACVGAIAKVVEAKRPLLNQSSLGGHFPAMLETTAAVHPGGSGGAVVNSEGHMIALVTSNARHGGGTVIPHLNFSIPCAALEPIFKFAEDMEDLSPLEYLDKPDEQLSSVWALTPPLSSKQTPSMLHLPMLPRGDTDSDTKGSKFAKFIADSEAMLKSATQLGKVERLSNKLLHSKL
ncbi:PREDICTED: glyoxysomal processing protease, glyoxysomal [Nicotiana attenuata]|uniref:Glyoxysomal processing protease, glyoxysomal n=1 Tax=Nicotiana attenuata TaxID=49451 RepID=A0A1J6L8L2_NICAT|nr:PREDICTED: glyoxysomal processing protease, glyoxysomal [Nicotiana attenuata]OIT27393.1 glyoxysomal processing protease, glyoxysomal [Nicotiana attenuata]